MRMRFPEETREGSQGHAEALRRLGEARHDEREKHEALAASSDSSGEPAAAIGLAAAREKTAAREAWVDWVERGY
jgi:hypothetical protein